MRGGGHFACRRRACRDGTARAGANDVVALGGPGAALAPAGVGSRTIVVLADRPTFLARARFANQQRIAEAVGNLGQARLSIGGQAAIDRVTATGAGIAQTEAHPDVSVVVRAAHRPVVGCGREEARMNRIGTEDVLDGDGGALIKRDANSTGNLVRPLAPVQAKIVSAARRNQHVRLFQVRQHDRQKPLLGVIRHRSAGGADPQIILYVRNRAGRAAGSQIDDPWRKRFEVVLKVVDRQADLPHLVAALHAAGGLPRRLYCGQQQRNQHADDRNHHQQFDERETAHAAWTVLTCHYGYSGYENGHPRMPTLCEGSVMVRLRSLRPDNTAAPTIPTPPPCAKPSVPPSAHVWKKFRAAGMPRPKGARLRERLGLGTGVGVG